MRIFGLAGIPVVLVLPVAAEWQTVELVDEFGEPVGKYRVYALAGVGDHWCRLQIDHVEEGSAWRDGFEPTRGRVGLLCSHVDLAADPSGESRVRVSIADMAPNQGFPLAVRRRSSGRSFRELHGRRRHIRDGRSAFDPARRLPLVRRRNLRVHPRRVGRRDQHPLPAVAGRTHVDLPTCWIEGCAGTCRLRYAPAYSVREHPALRRRCDQQERLLAAPIGLRGVRPAARKHAQRQGAVRGTSAHVRAERLIPLTLVVSRTLSGRGRPMAGGLSPLEAACAQRHGFRRCHVRPSDAARTNVMRPSCETPGIPEANHWNCLS